MKIEDEVLARVQGKGYEDVRIGLEGRVLALVNAHAVDKDGKIVYENFEPFCRVWGSEWPKVQSAIPLMGCLFSARGY